MSEAANGPILSYLRRISGRPGDQGVTDRELLGRVVTRRDEAAFELLLWRYGPMVRHVCLGVTRDHHEAEDAFQATFLVLARKAWSVRKHGSLGSWLYRVAYRIGRRARSQALRRAGHEKHGLDLRELPHAAPPAGAEAGPELRPLLLEEVNRLPAKYRTPVILCYLEGKTHDEAARHLGWPKGTVSGRLARARETLRARLARRGLAPSVGALTAALSPGDARALAPLLRRALRAGVGFAARPAAAAGPLSNQAVLLAEGMLRTMFLTRLRGIVAVVLAAVLLGSGAGLLARNAILAGQAPAEAAPPDRGPADSPPAGPAEKNTAVKKALRKLAGTWQVMTVESDGKTGAAEDIKGLAYVFEANGKWKLARDDQTLAEGTFVIDPAKDPPTIDYKIVSTTAEQDKGKSSLGIYELDGDRLKVCRTWPDNDQRPTAFAAPAGSKCILTEFQRKQAPADAPPPEEVRFRHGDDSLCGTLYRPGGAGPHPAVALVTGSEPSDRAYGGVGTALGRHFARHGFACLAWDRPGVGRSTGNARTQTFQDRAEEALAAVRYLRGRADVRRDAVGLWGHSQGGMIVPLAASLSGDVAFLIAVSGWQGPAWKQDPVRVEAELRADGFPEADVVAAAAFARRRMDLIRGTGTFEELDRAQEAVRASPWFAYVHRCDRARFDSARRVVGNDSATYWEHVHCPVLAIYGDRDTSSGSPGPLLGVIRRGLARTGKVDLTTQVFPDADHSLCRTKTGGPKEAAERARARRPGDGPDFVPDYLDAMSEWLAERFPPSR
jgi:RNA polymerase sigma factor (sigma-70 family)